MDQQRCQKCGIVMSYSGNDPSPVTLKCSDEVCLNCVTQHGQWQPNQEDEVFEFQCPVQNCGTISLLILNQVNLQLANFRKNIKQQMGNQQAQQNVNAIKCSRHNDYFTEFRCDQCVKMLCSQCILSHQDHCYAVFKYSKSKIVQD